MGEPDQPAAFGRDHDRRRTLGLKAVAASLFVVAPLQMAWRIASSAAPSA